jgi:hypothetical protein
MGSPAAPIPDAQNPLRRILAKLDLSESFRTIGKLTLLP